MENRQPSDNPPEKNTLTLPCGRGRKVKETPKVQAVSRISQLLMESLSLGPIAHSLSQCAKYTHPVTLAGGACEPLPGGSGVRRAKVTGTIWPAELCTHDGLPTVKASASAQCLLDVRGRSMREEQEPEQNLCSWGWSGYNRGHVGKWLESGGWVTLYLLHLSGKAAENSRGLLSLETTQGSNLLRTCRTSQMDSLQHQGNRQH